MRCRVYSLCLSGKISSIFSFLTDGGKIWRQVKSRDTRHFYGCRRRPSPSNYTRAYPFLNKLTPPPFRYSLPNLAAISSLVACTTNNELRLSYQHTGNVRRAHTYYVDDKRVR